MLDAFFEVACTENAVKTANAKVQEKLRSMPLELLHKLASSEKTAWNDLKACGSGDSGGPVSWLDQFKNTPLFDKALQLERADLQLEQEDIKQRQAQMGQETWVKRDALRLQRRLLELDLVLESNGAADAEQTEEKGVDLLEQAQAEERAAGEGGEPHELKEDAAIQQFRAAQSEEEAAKAKEPKKAPLASVDVKEASIAKLAHADASGRLLAKLAADLTLSAREHIKPKNFADPKGNGPGDTGKYPIEDKSHAKAALGLVGMHGSDAEKSKVRAAVAKKYPGLESKTAATTMDWMLPGIAGAAAGAEKGSKHNASGSLAIGGALGAMLGSDTGRFVGRALGTMTGAPPHVRAALEIAGYGLGGVAGYRGVTGAQDGVLSELKEKADHTEARRLSKKTAGIIGSALTAGKALLPQAASAAKGIGSLASTAYNAGGVGQVAKSLGSVAGGFAKANPLAAAGVAAAGAGAAGLAAGRLSKSNQPQLVRA